MLALYYASIARGPSLAWLCRIGMVLSFMAAVTAVLLMWALYPTHYDYGQALKMTNFFYNAQRVGVLPPDNSVPWRSNSLLYEKGVSLNSRPKPLHNHARQLQHCDSACNRCIML